jgi:hypothetical protein
LGFIGWKIGENACERRKPVAFMFIELNFKMKKEIIIVSKSEPLISGTGNKIGNIKDRFSEINCS